MRTSILIFLLALAFTTEARAQEVLQDSIQEVVVTAARTTVRPDGLHILPSESQLSHAATSYELLRMLQLPGIRINETLNTIVSTNPQGNVQIRINDIVAGMNELLRLDVKNIKSIDFIDAPGVRYGQGISHVIDIHTLRAPQGYTVGTRLSNTLNARDGNNNLFASYNHRGSEWNLSYNFGYNDDKGERYAEDAQYLLTDGTARHLSRNDVSARSRSFSNDAQLSYSLVPNDRSALQLSLSLAHRQVPGEYRQQQIIDGIDNYLAHDESGIHSLSPEIDLYYTTRWSDRQRFTANINLTAIHTDTWQRQDEGGLYQYTVDGKTHSLRGEGIYENQLKPCHLTAGLTYNGTHTSNLYSGDVNANNRFHRNHFYLFSQLKGKLAALHYVAGVGLTYQFYKQEDHRWHYWLWRPKLTASYPISPKLQLKYDFEMSTHTSSIAIINDTEFRVNSMEWKRGNPNLKPNRVIENILRLSYNAPCTSAFIEGFHRLNPHCNLEIYERTEDGKFVYTQRNQKNCNMFIIMGYLRHDLIEGKLSASANGGLYRFYNYGDTYRHHYTSFNGGASLDAYLGCWTLSAYADNGWHFLEGEHKTHLSYNANLSASYRIGACDIGLYWQQPLDRNYTASRSRIIDEMVQKSIERTSGKGNILTLSLTWKLSRGREYKKIERRKQKRYSEAGIL